MYNGKLIAVEGKCWPRIVAFSDSLVNFLSSQGYKCKVSNWNSSKIFSELVVPDEKHKTIPAKPLAIIYGADLARRLDKEIISALDAGDVVIANQYLDTPVALAAALGADADWLLDLYSFAPVPDLCFHVQSDGARNELNALGSGQGFYEYCLNLVGDEASGIDRLTFEEAVDDGFESLESNQKITITSSTLDTNNLASLLPRLFKSYESSKQT